MGGFAWVTLATNDSYSLGALVLGHALKQAGTTAQLVVLVTPGVTPPMRAKLSAVFNVVQEVNILDSKDEANLRLLKRPELGVTFTKLHCWRLTQFDKCVFLDADTLILSNCDELFQRDEFSAAPDVGWPDCFNSGVFVFKPSNDTYESLIKFALENGSFDGGDQGLLNQFFSDWAHKDITKRLPFIYNMCSIASYSYLPAFRQFGGQVKIVHFIGVTKPWLQYFDTESKQVQPGSGTEHLRQHLQLWWNIFCAQVHPSLTTDMEGLASAFAQFTLGSRRSENQSALEDHLRRQSWEVGNIDYLGRDSFSNIWSKISETMASSPPKTDRKEEQIIAQTVSASVAPPKPISAPDIPICTKPDAIQEQKLEQPVQVQQIDIALKTEESNTEGPPVTLKDILRPALYTAPITAPVCEKSPTTCDAKSPEIKSAPICESNAAGISAEIASSPVCEAKPVASPIPVAPTGTIEQPCVILAEGPSICAMPTQLCQKPGSPPKTQATPVCLKGAPVCEKTPASEAPAPICQKPICDKPVPLCEKPSQVIEKPVAVAIPQQTPAPLSTLPPTPATLPVEISTPPLAPPSAAIPLTPPVKEEPKCAPIIACQKPITTVETFAETASKPIVAKPAEVKVQDKSASCAKTSESTISVVPTAAAVPVEKAQEVKTETPSSSPPIQDNNGKNNKNLKKNNKNGKQEGKQEGKQQQQQQPPKCDKGNNKSVPKDVKSPSDVPTEVVKTEDRPVAPVPLPAPIAETPKKEPEVKPIAASCPTAEKEDKSQQKVDKAKKESPIAAPADQKPSEEPKVSEAPAVSPSPQDAKNKKNDKQKKDNVQGDKKADKSKEPQKSDSVNNQDKKKGGEKQEKDKQEKKPEQQGQKNGKKGNKGDNKVKKDGDQKSDEKLEQKIESKPEPKVDSKAEPTPETKEKKPEQKAEEKIESKPQEKTVTKPDSKESGKQGKDGKSDDKKRGGKDQKQQAPSPPKDKGKEQPPAVAKQEAATPVPMTAPSPAPPTPPAAAPVSAPPPAPAAEAEASKSAPEKPNSPTPQKQPAGNGKKESVPTPPPRKGNNGAKKGKKK